VVRKGMGKVAGRKEVRWGERYAPRAAARERWRRLEMVIFGGSCGAC
jgi:hypothetical protein